MGIGPRRWNGREPWLAQLGPHFSGEMGERAPGAVPLDPAGERVSFPHTPFLWTVVEAAWFFISVPGLRPLKPTPHGPPTSSGGREKWFLDGRKKWETKRFFSSFSQRVPAHVLSPPSRWAGRYGPSTVRAAGQVSRQKYSLPPHTHQRRGSRGRNLLPRGFFPPFLPKKWGPGWASHRSRPFQRRGTISTTSPPDKPSIFPGHTLGKPTVSLRKKYTPCPTFFIRFRPL